MRNRPLELLTIWRGNQLVHVGKVLIVETSMVAGMPKSNEGGSVVFYGIGGLPNQQRCCSLHRWAPLLVRPTGSAAVAGLSRLQQHKISPESVSSKFHAHPMQLVSHMARDSWPLSPAPGDSPDAVHTCWLDAATASFGLSRCPSRVASV